MTHTRIRIRLVDETSSSIGMDTGVTTTKPAGGGVAVPHAAAARLPAAAAGVTAGTTGESKRKADSSSSSSYVFLRIKRRRNEEPVECLVVQSEPEVKKLAVRKSADAAEEEKKGGGDDAAAAAADADGEKKKSASVGLLNAFTKLSTKEKNFVFKRIDTMEKHQLEEANHSKWTDRLKRKVKSMKEEPRPALKKSGAAAATTMAGQSLSSQVRLQQQQERAKERRKSDASRSRGLSAAAAPTPTAPSIEIKQQQTLELPGIRLVDLETVRTQQSPSPGAVVTSKAAATTSSSDGLTMNGARLRPTRVLNPSERELDESIWYAFRENDFSRFFKIFHSQKLESKLNPVTFQRPADGSTVLMAAAMHGRVDVIEVVLRSSAASALHQDWEGATAASFAARSGFKNVEAALLACEEAEREKDYVYDVYCVDVSASKDHDSSSAAGSAAAAEGGGQDNATANAPIVSVSAAVQRWLSQDANWQGEGDDVEEYMLESDAESDVDDGESVDSNDENHADNDYPDEESDGSDYDSDDSEQVQFRTSHGCDCQMNEDANAQLDLFVSIPQSTEHRRIWKRRPSDEGVANDDDLDY